MSTEPDPSQEDFMRALFAGDELTAVVRAHIHIEAKLLELLDLLVPNPQRLERMDLGFSQRVNLAAALGGLNADHAQSLLALGNLRNAFAHRLNSELTVGRANNLFDALSATDQGAVRDLHERTENIWEASFNNIKPRERFILICMALRTFLVTAIRDARANRDSS